MKDIIFSLNIVLPVFLIIVFGYILKNCNFVNSNFASNATSLVYYFALPVLLFMDVSKSDFRSLFHAKFIFFVTAATFGAFVALWLLGVLFIKDRAKISAFVHASFRGNYVYVGLPITQNILNVDVIPSSILIITFVIPLYNILAIILLSYYNQSNDKPKPLKLMKDVLFNPMIIAILVALPFSFFRIELPFAITKTFGYIGSLAIPLALLLIGIGIRFDSILNNLKYIVSATVAKMLIIPFVVMVLAVLLDFSTEEIVVIMVLFTAPSATNSFIMTKKLGGDAELVSGIIVATVGLSAFVIPLGASILKGIGML